LNKRITVNDETHLTSQVWKQISIGFETMNN